MEGTRHERVLVLITAYIIGFITAYIAFGVVKVQDIDYASFSNQNASVITSHTTKKTPDIDVFVGLDNEGLFVIKDNKRTLLSVKDSDDIPPGEGVFTTVTAYAISPDKSKVYFCEQPTEDSDSCRPYIYSIQDDVVYPVTINEERVAFPVQNHNVSWSSDGELIVK